MNDAQNRNSIRPDPHSPLGRLAGEWREDAKLLRRYGCEGQAEACERHAKKLEQAVYEHLTQRLTIREAADWSGYSEDHLRQMVREGRLPDFGRDEPRQGAQILVARHTLPRKPLSERSHSAGSTTDSENGEAEAKDSPRGRTVVERALDSVATRGSI